MFSVVIPLYNKSNHITRAIKSVLNQTYSNFEIIVINDGSTDDSLEKAESIEDDRIRIIDQKNAGVSVARNNGVLASKNDYIAFLDADDEWKNDYLETIAKLIEKFPEASIYGTGYERQVHTKKSVFILNSLLEKGWEGVLSDYFKYSINNHVLLTSFTTVSKKAFLETNYFTPGMTRGEDIKLWATIALSYDVAYSNTIRGIYYEDGSNRASTKKENYKNSFANEAEAFYESNKKNSRATFYFYEYMTSLFLTKAKYLIEMGKNREARAVLKKYNKTKYYKTRLIVLWILSFTNEKIYNFLLSQKNKS